MRQGGGAPTAKWTGSPLGGVKSPDALMLPDPATRFARTAARLEALSDGHMMAGWLHFMAALARSQHAAAGALGPVAGPCLGAVRQAVDAGVPPLAADRFPRDPAWRDGLALILDSLDVRAMPTSVQTVVAALRSQPADIKEALADGFLGGGVDVADVGTVVFVAAALQVSFTRLAADLPAPSLRLLPQRGLCPCCGSTPVAGVVTRSGATPGARYLYCSLCAAAWNHVRAVCITCGQSRSVAQRAIEGDPGTVKAETCDDCHSYAKMLYEAQDRDIDPFADDLASLGLDVVVAEAGWSRHAPNPLLLMA